MKNVPCTTPLLTYFRAWHAAHAAPRIFDDFLAYNLLTEQERDFFDRQFSEAVRIIDPGHSAGHFLGRIQRLFADPDGYYWEVVLGAEVRLYSRRRIAVQEVNVERKTGHSGP